MNLWILMFVLFVAAVAVFLAIGLYLEFREDHRGIERDERRLTIPSR